MKSKLGYLLSGPLPCTTDTSTSTLHVATLQTNEYDLQRFWAIEGSGASSSCNAARESIQSYIDSSISRNNDGSYTARFPWKENHPSLPTNKLVCEVRTRALVNKLTQTPKLLQAYDNILNEQERRGFIEQVPSPSLTKNCHYIPHHAVRKDSTTTPLRIVYDCSCHESKDSPSLNDCLEVGPPFLTDLCSVILRFRDHKFGISTDIEKAFLHVQLHPNDRDFTRFLWLSDISNPNSGFKVYRFKVVLFGATRSPFMLHAVLLHHLQQSHSLTATNMLQNLYVDNIITGCDTSQQAAQFYCKARSIMLEAKFNLRAWASNCTQLNILAQQEKVADNTPLVNILGLQWNTVSDTLQYIPKILHPQNLTSTPITKHQVLQQSSRVFDPLGFLAPVTVQAKLFLQRLWQHKITWDKPLENSLRDDWLAVAREIQDAITIIIPRHYCFTSDRKQLHVFADASLKAYGTVVYLTSGNRVNFIIAKTRVAPVQTLTLPRLELMAAVLASRVSKFVVNSLSLQAHSLHLWSDSQIVLYWIQSSKKLPPFVSHRITEIKSATINGTWRYCPTDDNPADLLTRGLTSCQLKSSTLWLFGPSWLTKESTWPMWQSSSTIELHAAVITAEEFSPSHPLTEPLGVHRVIALETFSKLRSKLRGPPTTQELYHAKMKWVKSCQLIVYGKEMLSLTSTSHGSKQLTLIRQLRLFIDDDGFIRCGGRIHNAPLSQTTKFPYLLPNCGTICSIKFEQTYNATVAM